MGCRVMKVTRTIKALNPDVVINAAAYTDVDGCEENIGHALSVNGEALEYFSRVCSEIGAILVHFSTDYVFDKPAYAADLARKTVEIVGLDHGIYHITNEGVYSWYEFASAIIPNAVPCSTGCPKKALRLHQDYFHPT